MAIDKSKISQRKAAAMGKSPTVGAANTKFNKGGAACPPAAKAPAKSAKKKK